MRKKHISVPCDLHYQKQKKYQYELRVWIGLPQSEKKARREKLG